MTPSDLEPGDPLRGAPEAPGYVTTPPPGAGGPPVQAPAPGALSGAHVLAGWWSRVGAALIDGLIVGDRRHRPADRDHGTVRASASSQTRTSGVVSIIFGFLFATLCVTIVAFLYAPAMMARTNGQTLGRMVLDIRVVRAKGQPMTFGWAMLREVAVKALLFGVVSSLTFGLASLLDVLWPLWDEENRALHDFIVDTRVIRA